jgi:Asp-tRNA(Asn)/Glu-tRNA(Gln) amidotransferase A subunit family amidase
LLSEGNGQSVTASVLNHGGFILAFSALTWVVAHALYARGRVTIRRLQRGANARRGTGVGKFHPALETNLRNSQAVESRDTQEYLAHIVKRNILRQAILKAMADNGVEVLAYPTIRRKANVIGETQMGSNCQLSANSGLPAIVVPGGFTPDGLPVGLELLGRAWSEPQLIKFAYSYEQATRHRRPPVSTPALEQQ